MISGQDDSDPTALKDLAPEELETLLSGYRDRDEVSESFVDALLEFATKNMPDTDVVFPLLDEAESAAKSLDYARGKCWSTGLRGAAKSLLSEHREALALLMDAKLQMVSLDDRRLAAALDSTLAGVHISLGNYETALTFALVALEAARKAGNRTEEAWLHHGIAAASNDLGDYEMALEHVWKSHAMFTDLLEESGSPQHAAGVGRCLTEIGVTVAAQGDTVEAARYHEQSLAIYREVDNRIGEARALNDLGRLKQDSGQYEEAEALHLESLDIRKSIKNRQSQSTSLLNLGDLYLQQGDVDKAIEYLDEALEVAEETEARLRIYQCHEALARAFEECGKLEAAVFHLKRYHEIKEHVSGDSMRGRVATMQLTHEVERAEKEAEIAHLRNVELRDRNEELKQILEKLHAAQDRLVHAQKMASLGELTAGIAHEIKNPLNFVNNFAAMSVELVDELRVLESQSGQPGNDLDRSERDEILDDLKANAHRILEHGQRADSIVKNMLSHARVSGSDQRPIDLNRLVEEYVQLAFHGARARDASFNATITRDYGDDVGDYTCAAQEIGRVLLNLLSNAFDAVHRPDEPAEYEPLVSVITRKLDDEVQIEIRDNGPGISPDIADRVFEPFFTTKPAGSGTGLGLSLSYDIIVQAYGGSLTFNSSPEKGTGFVVCLPSTR